MEQHNDSELQESLSVALDQLLAILTEPAIKVKHKAWYGMKVLVLSLLAIASTPFSSGTALGDDVPRQLYFQLSNQVFDTTITQTIAVGDLDNDGDLDAVFCNMAYMPSQVWVNDGKGVFTDSKQKLTELGHGVSIGDMDNDGDLDMLISCGGWTDRNNVSHYGKSRVYLNDGKASFLDFGQDFGDLNLSGNNAELHDVDNDGDLDAVIFYYKSENKIYLNDGRANFKDVGMTYPDYTFWGDLDKDSDVDMFVRQAGKGYSTRLNGGQGSFSEYWELPDTSVTRGRTLLVDIDNDGDLDALLAGSGVKRTFVVNVLLNDGKGRFEKTDQTLPSEDRIINMVAGDINNDGSMDLLITSPGQPYRIWLNNSEGLFTESEGRFGQDVRFGKAVLGDLDGDMDLDIFVANYWWGVSEIWFNLLD